MNTRTYAQVTIQRNLQVYTYHKTLLYIAITPHAYTVEIQLGVTELTHTNNLTLYHTFILQSRRYTSTSFPYAPAAVKHGTLSPCNIQRG